MERMRHGLNCQISAIFGNFGNCLFPFAYRPVIARMPDDLDVDDLMSLFSDVTMSRLPDVPIC